MSQILNVILKEAMKLTGLVQIGNRPKFFDTSTPIELHDMNMQIWSGFKACAYKYASGCALVIDNCSRFMTLETVLDQINNIYDETQDRFNVGEMNEEQRREFQKVSRQRIVNQSVITNFGNRRNYTVRDIQFETGPCSEFFELKNGEKISIARYFFITYKKKIT